MHIIDGTQLAARACGNLKQEIAGSGLTPCLQVLLVGDDKPSHLYVHLKQKRGEEIGIRVNVERRSADTPVTEIIDLIARWNADPGIHAILVQVPLPHGAEAQQQIINAIAPEKDVDGFHPDSVRALLEGTAQVVPPLHEGILRLIAASPVHVHQAEAVIIAKTDVFANPLAYLLGKAGARVTVMRPDALDGETLKAADIIVIGIGRKQFLGADLVKDGAVVVDVGTNKEPDGPVYGDVHRESFVEREVYLTPVPGGVGPMTIAQLLHNVFRLCQQQAMTRTE